MRSGWSSVYFFCGRRLQYCTCNFRWNIRGWAKAIVLWQFVLSATLGAQQFILQAGLGGLLPGEEAVMRESFISICWRLIPYWLNNWEQQWGAEVSSMTFELPHFAVELLIILPCCQIICSRLKVLVTPQVNVLLGPGQGQQGGGIGHQGQGQGPAGGGQGQAGGGQGGDDRQFVREDFAPNVLEGFWERRPEQRRFLPRVRSNLRVLCFLTALTSLAALNASLVPLYLEGQAATARDTPAVALLGRHAKEWLLNDPAAAAVPAVASSAPGGVGLAGVWHPGSRLAARGVGPEELALLPAVHARLDAYFLPPMGGSAGGFWAGLWGGGDDDGSGGKGCPSPEVYVRNVEKHEDPEHRSLIPLVESALAIMRLSCEKYFVLLAIYLAFLLFRDAPRPARAVIRIVARVSATFQKVILFAFPAVCWLYNAGIIFSIFVSVVFWGGPLLALYDSVRAALREVSIKSLSPATPEQVERMGGSCAICWGDMVAGHSHSQQGQTQGQAQSQGAGGVAPSFSAAAAGGGGEGPPAPGGGPASGDETLEAGGRIPSAGTASTSIATGGDGAAGGSGTTGATPVPCSVPLAAAAEPEGEAGVALCCGHAYHHACLVQWMEQCSSSGVTPTCPMCQRGIQLQVRWRLPPFLRRAAGGVAAGAGAGAGTARLLRGGAGAAAAAAAGGRLAAGGGPGPGVAAAAAELAAGEELLNAVRHFAGVDAGLQVVGLLEHQRELQELLHEAPPLELGELLREAQPRGQPQAPQMAAVQPQEGQELQEEGEEEQELLGMGIEMGMGPAAAEGTGLAGSEHLDTTAAAVVPPVAQPNGSGGELGTAAGVPEGSSDGASTSDGVLAPMPADAAAGMQQKPRRRFPFWRRKP
ncbi:hypothetical protein GPECTOR_299g810 [Gonium pectorale]|uniref:RING-type domain-containing protein n=1 Tax=Gonium pectorale TaxID=33097 RepID=A0A150FXI0_GONPE|nr:hypothetical protein GPECTOR_299g810 [Gonium pectorale]|eukprot:KXZ41740.1 hypothetical protein GPECTOR_299g810 [Gonium pectorale]